ncbi:FAD-binding oxidoreductase [Nocardia sp. NPDC051030]|uniref:FAD-binding oxidoreductase n=1 Tax=Nocardia sp. NPDC051030 TaxID=3155162 RepID=UPI00341237D2
MRWHPAELIAADFETPSARTLTLRVPDWPGHLPGQHLDVRLTAPDGYHAERSYSLAAPADGDLVQITIQRVPEGEVSTYLVDTFPLGASIEIRGPIGGWFVWNPDTSGPAVLIAGGSGIVPLAAMLRARRKSPNPTPFRLLYSLRDPAALYYRDELIPTRALTATHRGEQEGAPQAAESRGDELTPRPPAAGVSGGQGAEGGAAQVAGSRGNVSMRSELRTVAGVGSDGQRWGGGVVGGHSDWLPGRDDGVEVFLAYTRSVPPGELRDAGRLTAEEIARYALPPSGDVTCYVCGPTGFVEFAAAALVSAGHDPAMIRTERFGPTGK